MIGKMFFFSLSSFSTGVQGDIPTEPYVPCEVYHLPVPAHTLTMDSHNSGNFMPYSFQIVCGSLTSHTELINIEGICEMEPTVYSPYPRGLESLTICGCNYKGSTFSSVILRP